MAFYCSPRSCYVLTWRRNRSTGAGNRQDSATEDATWQEGREIPLTGPLGSEHFHVWDLRCSQRKLWNEHRVGTNVAGQTYRLHLQGDSKDGDRFLRMFGTFTQNCSLRCPFFATYCRMKLWNSNLHVASLHWCNRQQEWLSQLSDWATGWTFCGPLPVPHSDVVKLTTCWLGSIHSFYIGQCITAASPYSPNWSKLSKKLSYRQWNWQMCLRANVAWMRLSAVAEITWAVTSALHFF